MNVSFLKLDGCPNADKMWDGLQKAIRDLNLGITVPILDIDKLAEWGDPRAGFGSPTVLVDGTDLFGLALPSSTNPSCRFYPGGVPASIEIAERLKSAMSKK